MSSAPSLSKESIVGLTLHQPWATLVMIGEKKFETRSWKPPVGVKRIALHAARRAPDFMLGGGDANDRDLCEHVLRDRALPRGAILGVFEIVDVFQTETMHLSRGARYEHRFGNFEYGRFAWELKPVFLCQPPIYCAGFQRLWRLKPEIARVLSLYGAAA